MNNEQKNISFYFSSKNNGKPKLKKTPFDIGTLYYYKLGSGLMTIAILNKFHYPQTMWALVFETSSCHPFYRLEIQDIYVNSSIMDEGALVQTNPL